MSTRVATLYRLRRERRALDERIDNAFKSNWPAGSAIAWKKAGALQRGTVVRHGYLEKVMVRNDRTGAELWIHAYDVEAAGAAN